MKVCRSCKTKKANKKFVRNRRNSDGLDSYCKDCKKKKTSAYRQKPGVRDAEKDYQRNYDRTEANKKYYRNNSEKEKDRGYIRRHGLNTKAKESLLQKQGGKCAVCGVSDAGVTWNVDHSHVTGRVRGVLCWQCNVALGFVREDLRVLQNCIEYLKYHTGLPAITSDLSLALPPCGLLGKEIMA